MSRSKSFSATAYTPWPDSHAAKATANHIECRQLLLDLDHGLKFNSSSFWDACLAIFCRGGLIVGLRSVIGLPVNQFWQARHKLIAGRTVYSRRDPEQ
jgi:hypothetical protein